MVVAAQLRKQWAVSHTALLLCWQSLVPGVSVIGFYGLNEGLGVSLFCFVCLD